MRGARRGEAIRYEWARSGRARRHTSDHEVFGFHVAVNDAVFGERLERCQQLHHEGFDEHDREFALLLDQLEELTARYALHGEVDALLLF